MWRWNENRLVLVDVSNENSLLNSFELFFSYGTTVINDVEKRSDLNMGNLKDINKFLNILEENTIYYRLNKIRPESIMVEIAVPGQRWEIEFMEDGTIEIEKFISDGEVYSEKELEVLLKEFSD